MLLSSATLFFFFPAAYRFLREMKIITLPHPTYLKAFNLSGISSGINEPLKKYLEAKCKLLGPHERVVSLLLDEIYVKPKITYKGNKITGVAENTSELKAASTIQTFMITSVLSKNKDVAALVPVKNLDANFLHKNTLLVLDLLFQIGYKVICILADNNKVNDKLYKLMSNDNKVHSFVPHPFDSSEKLFLLFDTVHILKNTRNNLLNEKSKCFIYPSFQDTTVIKQCEFKHIVQIYNEQKTLLAKLAPGLSYKVCYPNNLERRNMDYVVPLFTDKTIAAVKTLLGDHGDGTAEWLQTMRNWWLTVNVKHPDKGHHIREVYAEPVRSMNQENIKFLKAFCSWLKSWDELYIIDAPKNCGKLSRETYTALLHTTESLILLCDHLLTIHGFRYVLLGKFQTDELERRFGQYRKMSGCNYNVSVQQIIESERKLKVTSLLKLQSKSQSTISVKDLINEVNKCLDQSIDMQLLEDDSEEIINASSEIEIDLSTLQVLIFIAGYVSFKVSNKQKCLECKNFLLSEDDLEIEPSTDADYLRNLSRGGLKVPSNPSVNIGVSVFQVFQCLVSPTYEKKFVSCDNPKSLTKTLALEVLEPMFSDEYCQCGKPVSVVVDVCVNIWVNIMLNNYSKVKTNLCYEENAVKTSKIFENGPTPAKRSRKATIFNFQ